MSGRAWVWVLAFVAAAGAGFAILVGVGCAIGANACPFSDRPPAAAKDGRSIYLANCAACHGINGQGGRGPALTKGDAALLSLQQLVAKIERGSPGLMPRYKGKLTPAQIETVARYVVELREAA